MLEKAKRRLESAADLYTPPGVELFWDPLPARVTGRFDPRYPLRIVLNLCNHHVRQRPLYVLVYELAHAAHWHATRFAHCSRAEKERFAVCTACLVRLAEEGVVKPAYADDEPSRLYADAERWFIRHGPEQARRWMDYVLCF